MFEHTDRRVPLKGVGLTSGTSPERILVVDDDEDAGEALRQLLSIAGYDAVAANSAKSALERIEREAFDLIVSDVGMEGMSGLDLCGRLMQTRPELALILVTGLRDIGTAIGALRLGVRDVHTKPVDCDALLLSVARVLREQVASSPQSLVREKRSAARSREPATHVLGQSAAIRDVHTMIAKLAGSLASVLIEGETGTGKEIIAHAIHVSSRVRSGPFVALNCAAVPAGLLESELFGHVRGAFTDAKAAGAGIFVQANGGTLLLDEIGELPLAMQPKLLRALQERVVRPVGGNIEVPFDCRVITATNRNLEGEVLAKRFREDLYYRLDVVRISVPALRARGDDVLLFAEHFLKQLANGARRVSSLSPDVTRRFLSYAWPGNVRELGNCLERAVALARNDELQLEDLPERIRGFETSESKIPMDPFALLGEPGLSAAEPSQPREASAQVISLLELERRHILGAMDLLRGDQQQAARVLGIDRRTLHRRLEAYQKATPG